MRILVTGGAGFIGSNLAAYLTAHGHNTVVLDDFSSQWKLMENNLEPEYIDNPYSFFQNHTEADITQTHAILGYAPRVRLVEGVRNYYGSGAL